MKYIQNLVVSDILSRNTLDELNAILLTRDMVKQCGFTGQDILEFNSKNLTICFGNPSGRALLCAFNPVADKYEKTFTNPTVLDLLTLVDGVKDSQLTENFLKFIANLKL